MKFVWLLILLGHFGVEGNQKIQFMAFTTANACADQRDLWAKENPDAVNVVCTRVQITKDDPRP